jgi:hypothetical protein
MSEPRRQHYVPRLILRRFSPEPAADNPSIWRLDKDSGTPARTHISNEAVISHYYRLGNATKLPSGWAEKTLGRIEADAATPIRKLVDREPITPLERGQMAFFLHVQHQRTPLARQWSADRQARLAELQMEVNLSDRERVHEKARSLEDPMSDEEIERWRLESIEGLRSGTIVAEARQDHEVGGIFLVGDRIASVIGEQMGWCSLQAAPGTSFICSDHPLHIYDRSTPPDRGVGWISSPQTEVTMPLDQRVCLLLRPGPPTWVSLQADAETVDDINLRTYASARWSIYGPSQRVVQRVREMAKRDRARVLEYEPRGPRLVLFESWEGGSKPDSVRVYRPPVERPRRRPK